MDHVGAHLVPARRGGSFVLWSISRSQIVPSAVVSGVTKALLTWAFQTFRAASEHAAFGDGPQNLTSFFTVFHAKRLLRRSATSPIRRDMEH